jgi:putative chitinase
MLGEAMERFEIDTPARASAFLEFVAHESNECRNLEEDLSYSAAALLRLWPNRFPNLASAQLYERKPEMLANFVYANHMGNGPPESYDGYRYRGRGLIRIIGRACYTIASAALEVDFVNRPQLLLEPRNAALCAAWFWKTRGLNELADNRSGYDLGEFRQLTAQRALRLS